GEVAFVELHASSERVLHAIDHEAKPRALGDGTRDVGDGCLAMQMSSALHATSRQSILGVHDQLDRGALRKLRFESADLASEYFGGFANLSHVDSDRGA